MMPTLTDGQNVFIFPTNDYQIGDIVIINVGNDEFFQREYYVKRIIAQPGDLVEVNNTGTFVNGEYINDATSNNPIRIVLKETELFVEGDNYSNSLDSRILGPFEQSQIISEVIKY